MCDGAYVVVCVVRLGVVAWVAERCFGCRVFFCVGDVCYDCVDV